MITHNQFHGVWHSPPGYLITPSCIFRSFLKLFTHNPRIISPCTCSLTLFLNWLPSIDVSLSRCLEAGCGVWPKVWDRTEVKWINNWFFFRSLLKEQYYKITVTWAFCKDDLVESESTEVLLKKKTIWQHASPKCMRGFTILSLQGM